MKKILSHLRRTSTGGTRDRAFMNRAIELAWRGAGRVHPNPLVGSVVVSDGEVVGEGFHEAFGLDHAETVALDEAGSQAAGATLYVTLEPCTHHGKTPPCIDRIVSSGVDRVVVGTLDPDPRMNGAGVEALRRRGIDVSVGCQSDHALLLNTAYFKRVLGIGRSVTLKMATTLDGRIARRRGSRDAISGAEAQRFVHRLRSMHDAVLIGIDTLLIDHPRLDCRLFPDAPVPVPVVADTGLRCPEDYRWAGEGGREFILLTGPNPDAAKSSRLERGGVTIVPCALDAGRVSMRAALENLGDMGFERVLVEGGADIFSSFMGLGLWDTMHVFVSPLLFGPDAVDLAARPLEKGDMGAVAAMSRTMGDDVLISFLQRQTKETVLESIA